MKITVLYFSEETRKDKFLPAFPEQYEVILLNSQNKDFIDNSVFKTVASFLDARFGLELITISKGIIPNWNKSIWNSHFDQAKNLGSSIYRPIAIENDEYGYLATFNVKDLKMALEQNYRPVFENIDEAFNTFGFKSYPFDPDITLS